MKTKCVRALALMLATIFGLASCVTVPPNATPAQKKAVAESNARTADNIGKAGLLIGLGAAAALLSAAEYNRSRAYYHRHWGYYHGQYCYRYYHPSCGYWYGH